MSIDEPHFVTVSLGNAGDEVLDVAESGADGGASLPGAEPSLNPELTLAGFLVLNEMEVEVEVLEVADELTPGTLNFDNLGFYFDVNPIGDVHRLRRKNGLHVSPVSQAAAFAERKKITHSLTLQKP